MSNVKVHSPNKIQISKIYIYSFVIPLTFACLPVGRDFEIWNL
jgi:hypothetical protein